MAQRIEDFQPLVLGGEYWVRATNSAGSTNSSTAHVVVVPALTLEAVGTWQGSNSAAVLGVSLHGNLAYVAAENAGLQIIDLSNPAAPERVGAIVTPGSATAVHATGSRAYVAGGSRGLDVLDVSDPAKPVLSGTWEGASVQAIDVSSKFAYLATAGAGLQIT